MADLTIKGSPLERMVGSGHPTYADTLNRLSLVEHNNDGTHNKLTKVKDPYVDVRAFGAVGDGVTDDTAAIQEAINYASNYNHKVLFPQGKFKSGRLRFYYDVVNNPGYSQNGPGRITIGGSSAETYGQISRKNSGTQLIHKDGEATPFLDFQGDWAGDMPGAFVTVKEMLLIGGSSTTEVVRLEDMNINTLFENLWIRVVNNSCDGILYYRSWQGIFRNIRIQGGAVNDGTWTGRGFATYVNETVYDSDQTVNMTLLENVDIYEMGRGLQIGSVSETAGGIVGPIVILGGQESHSDQEGCVIGSGAVGITFIGHHIEASRLNGLKIVNATGGGAPQLITYQGGTFYGNGTVGTGDEWYNVWLGGTTEYCENFRIDSTKFFNCTKGIKVEVSDTTPATIQSIDIDNLIMIPSTAGEGASGEGIFIEAGYQFNQRITIGDNIKFGGAGFNGGASNIVDTNNNVRKKVYRSRAHTYSSAETTPAINAWDSTIYFQNTGATSVTNLTGADRYQEVVVLFSNTNTTLVDVSNGGNFKLGGAKNYTPNNQFDAVTLIYHPDGNHWVETGRRAVYGAVSADNGDAAATLTAGTSHTTQRWAAALTADRAVTLSTTGAVNGSRFRIVRTATATGAFNLNVGTGPLKALATAGTWCEVEYNGTAWMLTAYGAL